MTRRVPLIYLTTLATNGALLVLSGSARSWTVLMTAVLALLCLGADIALMMRENVPINGAIDRWSATDPPADWEDYRDRSFSIFAYRQVILLVGYIALLFGAVFQS